MTFEISIDPAALAQLLVFPISLAAYLPHWLTMIRNRSSRDVSLVAQALWTVGSALAMVYPSAIYLNDGVGLPLLATAVLNFICALFTSILIAIYRNSSNPEEFVEVIAGEAIQNVRFAEDAISEISPLIEAQEQLIKAQVRLNSTKLRAQY